jgi:hypothetical protein
MCPFKSNVPVFSNDAIADKGMSAVKVSVALLVLLNAVNADAKLV